MLQNMLSLQHILASFEPQLEVYHCPFTNVLFHPLISKVTLDHLIKLFMLFEVLIVKLELHWFSLQNLH